MGEASQLPPRGFGVQRILIGLLLFLLPLLAVPSHAGAAAADPCAALVKDFDALRKDAKKAALRDNWLKLENRFKTLADKSSGDTRIRALFYYARSREELAGRSFSSGDAAEAAKRFDRAAEAGPKHSLAPERKSRQAALLAGRAGRVEEAKAALGELQKKWPASQAAKDGKALADRLDKAPPRQTAGASGQGGRAGGGRTPRAGAKPSSDVMEQLGLGVHTIIIDPGHGGKDPGTMHGKLMEKKLTMTMARTVGGLLEKKGIKVIYTRTGDTYPSLEDRTHMANESKADLFISLHYNANANSATQGLEIYYLSKARSADAAAVAARENGVSAANVSDLQFILTDLMLGAKLEESRALADSVRRGIMNKVKGAGYSFYDNGVRPAPFYVLVGARMPAVLVEFGYVTNPGDAAKIADAAFCRHQAEGLVNGILAYRDSLAKVGSVPKR